MTFKIPEENQNKFAKRRMKKDRKIAFGIGLLLFSLLLFSMDPNKLTVNILYVLLPLGLFVFFIPYLWFFNYSNAAESVCYFISSRKVEEVLLDDSLSFANKVSIERNKRRYNVEPNKSIPISEIVKIEFSDEEISIYSNNYSWFTGNGRIVIPCEVKDYEKAYKEVEKISKNI